ncbi:hypothetical protein KKC91_03840 [bacterium]|nr:hypothetical protein [bacterium]
MSINICAAKPAIADDSILSYKVGDGRIEIKPRLKYELIISLHALKFTEDHDRLFISWALQMREDLSEKTLREATVLIENSHESQLCHLVQNYDGPDEIEPLIKFIKKDKKKEIQTWAKDKWNSALMQKLGISFNKFTEWYGDFLNRYYHEGFEKQWLTEHRKLVYEDAKSLAKELGLLNFSPITFMEQLTGRRFSGSTKIILYPSSFSRPQRAYGFSEAGHKVVVYQIKGSTRSVLRTIFHELLHPLIRGWQEAKRMKTAISILAKEPLFKEIWEKEGKGNYSYPNGWLEELFVHSIAEYMGFKAGLISEEVARRQSYTEYENALYDAIFDCYDTFEYIDDFIYYAITHIKTVGAHKDVHFVYYKD